MGERLDSWKAIAAYLGREVRTVQRWAASRCLPVHHLPGGDRPRVFSLTMEIDEWLRARPGAGRDGRVPIAVMPLHDLSGTADGRRFAAGLAQDVVNALMRMPGLQVAFRTTPIPRPARRPKDERRTGARLGASWLLEGSVWRERRRVRVHALLTNARDGFCAWSERYDREVADVFTVKDDIAGAIACAVAAALPYSR